MVLEGVDLKWLDLTLTLQDRSHLTDEKARSFT
jgi:hypothetical protein